MVGRKRKHGEPSLNWNVWHSLWLCFLGIGLITVMLVSVNAMWQWVMDGQLMFISQHAQETYVTSPPKKLGPAPVTPAIAVNLAEVLPEGAQLVLSNANGELFENESNAEKFTSLHVHGDNVTIAPDGKTLAYTRDSKLYLNHYVNSDGTEQAVSVPGNPVLLAWDRTGKNLAFVVHGDTGDTVYRLTAETLQVSQLLTVPEIVAPPLTHPGTGRLVIAEKTDSNQTDFYTIDANCIGQTACMASRREMATVHHAVSWATFHPNAGSIIFSDSLDGNLYLLMTGSGDVEPLVTDSSFKQHPVINGDGTWLAYTNLTDGGTLYVMDLADRHIHRVPISNITSVAWAN